MDVLLLVGLAIAMLFAIDRAGLALSDGAVRVLVRGFVAWLGGKLDPWPSGMQEEDRDQPWGRSVSPSVPLTKVQATLSRH
jgi:hypothetical protein